MNLNGTMSVETGRKALKDVIENGSALHTFRRMLIAQGVDVETADRLCNIEMNDIDEVWTCLKKAEHNTDLTIPRDGNNAHLITFSNRRLYFSCCKLASYNTTISPPRQFAHHSRGVGRKRFT